MYKSVPPNIDGTLRKLRHSKGGPILVQVGPPDRLTNPTNETLTTTATSDAGPSMVLTRTCIASRAPNDLLLMGCAPNSARRPCTRVLRDV